MITKKTFITLRALAMSVALSVSIGFPTVALADGSSTPSSSAKEPPRSWIDPDTGHRVIRLTNEPGTDSFYFNFNGYTPDGKEMAYTTTDASIGVVNLVTFESRIAVKGPVRSIIVGHKTPTVYYTKQKADPFFTTLWCTNLDTGETRELADDLPRRGNINTINADETLGAGTFIEGNASTGGAYGGTMYIGAVHETTMPANKGQMMTQRLAAKLPNTLYTVDLNTGKTNFVMQHSTDWLNHVQFSPTDPTLLMYCHEGSWTQVDRIWTIRTDGSQNQLIHKRTMEMESAGHEWWEQNGKNIWYDLSLSRGVSYIAGYNVENGDRIWFHKERTDTSIHYNSSLDGTLFCGDGGRGAPWILLFRPERFKDNHTLGTNLIHQGIFHTERLVNMSKHNYRLEPNVTFTPDQKYVVFRSNMFGPDYSFAVEVAKAATP